MKLLAKKFSVFVLASLIATSLSAPAFARTEGAPDKDHPRKEFSHDKQKRDHDGKFEKDRHDRKEMRGKKEPGKDWRKDGNRNGHRGDPRPDGKKHD